MHGAVISLVAGAADNDIAIFQGNLNVRCKGTGQLAFGAFNTNGGSLDVDIHTLRNNDWRTTNS
jgi:hypothetical protein